MRTKIFCGAVIGLLSFVATSFAGWDATDKALGHEGKALRMNSTYRAMPAQQAYRAPVVSATIVAAPAVVPQVAQTNTNTERRSFSVEPNPATVMSNSNTVSNNAYYSAPRSYNNNARFNHQPNYMSADTKILGHEGR